MGECATRLTEEINTIEKGISEKINRTVHALSTVSSAFIIAFVLCWHLALILLWSVVAGLIVMTCGVLLSSVNNREIVEARSTAASIAEEALSSIRNVKAMGAEERLANNYGQILEKGARWATGQRVQLGGSFGEF